MTGPAPRAVRTASVAFAADVPVELHVPADADGSVVVALHGMGQSAARFAREAVPCAPPRAAVLLPQGPYPFEMRRDEPGPDGRPQPPRQGNAWYVWTGDSDGFRRALEHVESWLVGVVSAQVAAAGLDPSRVALLGFSQGGYLAGFVGLRRPDTFRALVVAAGRIKDEFLADVAPAAAAAGLRVLGVHGTRDEAVVPDACRASLARIGAAGVATEFRTYDAGHAVLRDPRCRDDVRAFLES